MLISKHSMTFLKPLTTIIQTLTTRLTPISQTLKKAIKFLKINKASGLDNITNEYINCSIETMLPVYHKLFNKTLDSGILPETWLVGTILSIYKNKCDIVTLKMIDPLQSLVISVSNLHLYVIAVLTIFSTHMTYLIKANRDLENITLHCHINNCLNPLHSKILWKDHTFPACPTWCLAVEHIPGC